MRIFGHVLSACDDALLMSLVWRHLIPLTGPDQDSLVQGGIQLDVYADLVRLSMFKCM